MRFVFLVTILSSLFLSSCSDYHHLKRHTIDNQDKSYYTALAIGYRELAELEREQYDWSDSNYFARKGKMALERRNVEPTHPRSKNIVSSIDLNDLLSAHYMLIEVVDDQTKDEFPLLSAHLQTLFDVWVEKVEEQWEREQIQRARDEFFHKLNQLRDSKRLSNRASDVKEKQRNIYTIYFDNRASNLDYLARKEVNKIIYALKSITHYQLILEGHTDLLGDANDEYILSKSRVDTVKEALIKGGIPERRFYNEKYIGSKHRKIKTSLDTTDRMNRRVNIYIVSGVQMQK